MHPLNWNALDSEHGTLSSYTRTRGLAGTISDKLGLSGHSGDKPRQRAMFSLFKRGRGSALDSGHRASRCPQGGSFGSQQEEGLGGKKGSVTSEISLSAEEICSRRV